MKICNDPVLFSRENIDKICNLKNAKYVCDTTLKNGADCAIFYADIPHPDSNSRYFGLYNHPITGVLYICNASEIEDISISAVIADNGDIVYSRYRHDFRYSDDKSVWIDGGREYVRSGLYDKSRWVTLIVKDGELKIKEHINED